MADRTETTEDDRDARHRRNTILHLRGLARDERAAGRHDLAASIDQQADTLERSS